jgi:transposase
MVQNFGLKSGYLQKLQKHFIETGEVLVFGGNGDTERTQQEQPATKKAMKIFQQAVNSRHGNRETVTKQEIVNFVRQQFNIEASKSTMTRYLRQLRLSWQNARSKNKMFEPI